MSNLAGRYGVIIGDERGGPWSRSEQAAAYTLPLSLRLMRTWLLGFVDLWPW
jgi:hypothetical protein